MDMNKIIRGCWQLSAGHDTARSESAELLEALVGTINGGFNTFDCADIYVGVEELLGRAMTLTSTRVRVHTKFVPDLDRLEDIGQGYVERIIDRTRRRLGVDTIDLVQFHWWNFDVKQYLPVLDMLAEHVAAGKIAALGLTNVDTERLEEIAARFPIAAVQAQVSLLDRRITHGVSDVCARRGIKVLAYGCLLGGFLHEKWLDQPEPSLESLANRSLVKYKLIIDDACGWDGFQRRLRHLHVLAQKYGVSIGRIALAFVLQSGLADAGIVGLSRSRYEVQNRSLQQSCVLSNEDLGGLLGWTSGLPGDVYGLERIVDGKHAKIMCCNLNEV